MTEKSFSIVYVFLERHVLTWSSVLLHRRTSISLEQFIEFACRDMAIRNNEPEADRAFTALNPDSVRPTQDLVQLFGSEAAHPDQRD